MTKKVFALDTAAGIQRDGTVLDKTFYNDGRWVRFQRARPRKILGYRQITDSLAGPSRGIFVNPESSFNNVFNGYSDGLQVLPISNNGVGSGISDFTFRSPINALGTIVGGSGYTNGEYKNIPLTGGSGYGAIATITVDSNSVSVVTITNDGNGYAVNDSLSASAGLIGNGIETVDSIVGGSLYLDGSYLSVPLLGGAGTGATANIVVSGGSVTSVTIQDRGVGYEVGDDFSIYYDLIGGVVGIINAYTLLSRGSLYTPGTYSGVTFTGGSGAGAVGDVIVTENAIFTLTTLVGGSDYTNGSFTGIALTGGTGTGAIGTITISGGTVTGVVITYGGNNYAQGDVLSASASSIGNGIATIGAITGGSGYVNGLYPNVSLTGGTGTGAKATITVSSGYVSNVVITSPGVGYTVADSLTTANTNIGGTGSAFAVAVATVESSSGFQFAVQTVSSGSVGQVTLTSNGQNYLANDVLSAPASSIGGVSGIIGSLGSITSGGFYTDSTLAGFTGSISGTVLTVTAVATGTIVVGQTLFGTGITENTVITALGSGSGGVGTYNINTSQTVGSQTINAIGVFRDTPLTGGSGTGATANIIVYGGVVSAVAIVNQGVNYAVGDSLSATIAGITNGIATVGTLVGGSLYTDGTYTDVALTGGAGTGAKATIVVASNAVSSVTITSAGQNYVVGNTLSCAASAIGNGVNAYTSLAGGSNYANGTYTNVSLTGGTGSGAKATIVVSGNVVNTVTITSRGVGYTNADVLTTAAANLGGVVNGVATFGAITAGSNYTNGTYTNVPLSGGAGTGVTANITVSGNAVTAVTLGSKGNNYVVGNTLSSLAAYIGNGIQSIGTITGGSGYTAGTYTSVPVIGGSGSGALATVVVAGGKVTSMTITSRGTGYVYGNIISVLSTNIGGTGSGFAVPVSAVYASSGFSIPVATVITASGFSITLTAPYASTGFSTDVASLGSAGGFLIPITFVLGSSGFQFIVQSVQQSSGFQANVASVYDSTGFSVSIASIDSIFEPSANNLWQFDLLYDPDGSTNLLLAHPGKNLNDINNPINTPIFYGPSTGTSVQPLKDTGGTNPTGDVISVSGGVVSLHPYIFVYGNDGLIKNCAAGDPTNWTGADSNENNVAGNKIVKGLPVRGGSNSPSGLFWSLDSLIRVSYNPTTITAGGVATQLFWRYDIISSQSSILSSQSVIEYDGIYYWCGVDRFLQYNGVVKEIPNTMNQNYFFDNLNYAQRQKVWATKVPRYGEIWWFYPSGDSEECNNAIIYNVRENIWYDAGFAPGAARSAGYFSQVFRFPINAEWDIVGAGGVNAITTTNAGSAYTDGTYPNISLTGGTGLGAYATITVVGGVVTEVLITAHGLGYTLGDTLTGTIPGGSGLVITVDTLMEFVSLWQHEFGTDDVRGVSSNAIESYFETSDLGWVGGGPSQPSPVGENFWLHVERVEPDFIQTGGMEMYVTGRPYAQADDVQSEAYPFTETTNKIDIRQQRREFRLKFVSNVAGGDYQLGRLLLSANVGDVRGY